MDIAKHKLKQFKSRVRKALEAKASWDHALRDALILTFSPSDFRKCNGEASVKLEGLHVRIERGVQAWHWSDDIVQCKGTMAYNGTVHEFSQQASNALWKRANGEATGMRGTGGGIDRSRVVNKSSDAAMRFIEAMAQASAGKPKEAEA